MPSLRRADPSVGRSSPMRIQRHTPTRERALIPWQSNCFVIKITLHQPKGKRTVMNAYYRGNDGGCNGGGDGGGDCDCGGNGHQ